MNFTVRPKAVLLPILIIVFIFAIAYLSYLQNYNQNIYRLNVEMEQTTRLVYEMTRDKESGKAMERLAKKNDFTYYQTNHFDIYCQNPALAAALHDQIEKVYRGITAGLGYSSADLEYKMEQRIKIFIFRNVDEYRRQTESPFPWSIGNAVYKTNSFYSYDGPHLPGLIPHEMAHLLFNRFLKGSYDFGAMRWLSEGVAMYGEASVYNTFANEVLAPKLDLKHSPGYIPLIDLIKAKELEKEDLNRVHLWYAECLSVASFMIDTEGKEKFKEFCLTLARERNMKEAIAKVYPDEFGNIGGLQKQWLKYLKTHRQKW
ncbi:MAG: peptidase MA family metallohydrolase [bacterium]